MGRRQGSPLEPVLPVGRGLSGAEPACERPRVDLARVVPRAVQEARDRIECRVVELAVDGAIVAAEPGEQALDLGDRRDEERRASASGGGAAAAGVGGGTIAGAAGALPRTALSVSRDDSASMMFSIVP